MLAAWNISPCSSAEVGLRVRLAMRLDPPILSPGETAKMLTDTSVRWAGICDRDNTGCGRQWGCRRMLQLRRYDDFRDSRNSFGFVLGACEVKRSLNWQE